MKICSFDFDKTIDTPAGYAYASELIGRGHRVVIVTQRPPFLHREVFIVAQRLGLEIDDIYFCGVRSKEEVLEEIDAKFHLDDKRVDSRVFVEFKEGFRDKCEKLLK